jgi:hypothetical protein
MLDTMEFIGYTSIEKGLDSYISYIGIQLEGNIHVFSRDTDDKRIDIYLLD